jgi:hypothetical protein
MEEKGNSFELVESRDAIDLVPRWEPQAWWFFAASAVVAVAILAFLLLRRKKPAVDLSKEKREAYFEAKSDLGKLGDVDLRDTTIRVSIILRRYLARSMNEPALFETHEEFIARHYGLKDLPDDMRSEVGGFFSKLAAFKYAPDDIGSGNAHEIHADGTALLERIHRA